MMMTILGGHLTRLAMGLTRKPYKCLWCEMFQLKDSVAKPCVLTNAIVRYLVYYNNLNTKVYIQNVFIWAARISVHHE